jgi:hypothetical protein
MPCLLCAALPSEQVSVNGEKFAQRHVYLFSDALVVVQRIKKEKKTKKKFLFVCQLLFETAVLSDVKDGSMESGTTFPSQKLVRENAHDSPLSSRFDWYVTPCVFCEHNTRQTTESVFQRRGRQT